MASSCSSDKPAPRRIIGNQKVSDTAVPPMIGGLRSTPEDTSKALKEASNRAYVSDAKFWSLREGDRLRAAVQVSRFTPDAPTGEEEFRLKVAAQVGEAAPRIRRVGDEFVFVSAGNRQTYYMWFRNIYFVVFSVPSEETTGRSLLREALVVVKP